MPSDSRGIRGSFSVFSGSLNLPNVVAKPSLFHRPLTTLSMLSSPVDASCWYWRILSWNSVCEMVLLTAPEDTVFTPFMRRRASGSSEIERPFPDSDISFGTAYYEFGRFPVFVKYALENEPYLPSSPSSSTFMLLRRPAYCTTLPLAGHLTCTDFTPVASIRPMWARYGALPNPVLASMS